MASSDEKIGPPEFYGWECVSLKLENRTLDFVIQNRIDMAYFIQAIELLLIKYA